MKKQFSMKELEDVVLKATYPIEIGNRVIEKGEVIARFDKIQISNFEEIKEITSARGGFSNRSHVWWSTTKELKLDFIQGVFSKEQFALLNNAKLLESDNTRDEVWIQKAITVESDNAGYFKLDSMIKKDLFIYDYHTGEKITDYQVDEEGKFHIDAPYKDLRVEYMYKYEDGFVNVKIGQELVKGFLTLVGKTRYQDDELGQIKTGIIQIPKLKLMSNLSMRLGENASPVVGSFSGVAVPVGVKGNSYVMDIRFLDRELDTDD